MFWYNFSGNRCIYLMVLILSPTLISMLCLLQAHCRIEPATSPQLYYCFRTKFSNPKKKINAITLTLFVAWIEHSRSFYGLQCHTTIWCCLVFEYRIWLIIVILWFFIYFKIKLYRLITLWFCLPFSSAWYWLKCHRLAWARAHARGTGVCFSLYPYHLVNFCPWRLRW